MATAEAQQTPREDPFSNAGVFARTTSRFQRPNESLGWGGTLVRAGVANRIFRRRWGGIRRITPSHGVSACPEPASQVSHQWHPTLRGRHPRTRPHSLTTPFAQFSEKNDARYETPRRTSQQPPNSGASCRVFAQIRHPPRHILQPQLSNQRTIFFAIGILYRAASPTPQQLFAIHISVGVATQTDTADCTTLQDYIDRDDRLITDNGVIVDAVRKPPTRITSTRFSSMGR
jgi:hypothetical protein